MPRVKLNNLNPDGHYFFFPQRRDDGLWDIAFVDIDAIVKEPDTIRQAILAWITVRFDGRNYLVFPRIERNLGKSRSSNASGIR
jgi:hypothetical protein